MKKIKKSRLYRQNLKKRSLPYKYFKYKNIEKNNEKMIEQSADNFIMLKHNAEKRAIEKLNEMGLDRFLEFVFKRI